MKAVIICNTCRYEKWSFAPKTTHEGDDINSNCPACDAEKDFSVDSVWDADVFQ